MKFLYITHLSGKRVNRFWLTSIAAVKALGGEFHLACNMDNADTENFLKDCRNYGIIPHQINFNRNPLSLQNINACKELVSLLREENFDLIHTNTPVGGLVGRIAAHIVGSSMVIYQAHGFHFWKGAPLKNWLCYYPVERLLAHYTDTLITINKEDYKLAKSFRAKHIEYVPGVGINTQEFKYDKEKRVKKRNELRLKDNSFVLLSVGELIPRKNHKMVIDAINKLKGAPEFKNIQYYILGSGDFEEYLSEYVHKFGLESHVHLLGYRLDADSFYDASDVFVFMSYQEGLPVALMEAMASRLPVICSNIRGNSDLVSNNKNGALINIDVNTLAEKIKDEIDNRLKYIEMSKIAEVDIQKFDFQTVKNKLFKIYKAVLNDRKV